MMLKDRFAKQWGGFRIGSETMTYFIEPHIPNALNLLVYLSFREIHEFLYHEHPNKLLASLPCQRVHYLSSQPTSSLGHSDYWKYFLTNSWFLLLTPHIFLISTWSKANLVHVTAPQRCGGSYHLSPGGLERSLQKEIAQAGHVKFLSCWLTNAFPW